MVAIVGPQGRFVAACDKPLDAIAAFRLADERRRRDRLVAELDRT